MSPIDIFLEFERELGLYHRKYKGVYYWNYLRTYIYIALTLQGDFDRGHPDIRPTTLRRRLGFLTHLPKQFKNLLGKEKYDLFITYSNEMRTINGTWLNPFTDFLRRDTTFTKLFDTPVFSDWDEAIDGDTNNSFVEFLYCFYYLYIKLGTASKLLCIPGLKELVEQINIRFDCNFNYEQIQHIALTSIYRHKAAKRYFCRFLRNRARCVVMGCHYNTYNMGIIDAAHTCNIPVVELEHGAITREHIGYNMLADPTHSNQYIPDYFFAFGSYFAKSARLPARCKIKTVGFPLMDMYRKAFSNPCDKMRVIFYSNGANGVALSKLALEFAHIAKPKGYQVSYKFHPHEIKTWRQNYPWLADDRSLDIEDGNRHVFEYLSSAKHHVTAFSSVVYEAFAFDGLVYMFKTGNYFNGQDIIDKGDAVLFDTAAELLAAIECACEKQVDSSYYYTPDASNTILNNLQKIVKSASPK